MNKKVKEFTKEETQKRHKKESGGKGNYGGRKAKEEDTFLESASKNTMVRQLGRTIMRELTRGFLGVLGSETKKKATQKKN